ncbi:MAG: hypothetical protein JPMHGGIA_02830 [Saprospiraceae bacterium]|nr:hypothetical protein [Saprospiraceae bacterium]
MLPLLKLLHFYFVFLFISASAIAQSNEKMIIPTEGGKYVSCGHDHDGQPCGSYTFVPDEVTDVQASPAGPTGACTPRPYRQLVAYDDQLLVNYTHQQIVDLVMQAHKRFANALDSSGITNQVGTRVVGIIPVTIPAYTKLSDVFKWTKDPVDGKLDELYRIKNDSLDADHLLILSKEGISASDKGVNLGMTTLPGGSLSDFLSILWKKNCGIINFITMVPKPSITFAHESGHGIGGGHESNNPGFPSYANAYVNNFKQVNTIMKGASVESWVYDRFSGPNSKIVKNGETITMCEDTAVHNNAKHITECLDRIWCATENHVTRVSIQPTTCGSGTLHAITNNADTFQWKVISGDCSLGATTGKDVPYMANATATIQVIGWKQGKWYADTAYIDIPALQHTILNSTINQGEFFILPNNDTVTMSGSYTVTLKNQNGCDSLITTNLSVITSSDNLFDNHIEFLPNPVHEYLYVRNLDSFSNGNIISINGFKKVIDIFKKEISVKDLTAGTYFIQLIKDNRIYQKTFIKI